MLNAVRRTLSCHTSRFKSGWYPAHMQLALNAVQCKQNTVCWDSWLSNYVWQAAHVISPYAGSRVDLTLQLFRVVVVQLQHKVACGIGADRQARQLGGLPCSRVGSYNLRSTVQLREGGLLVANEFMRSMRCQICLSPEGLQGNLPRQGLPSRGRCRCKSGSTWAQWATSMTRYTGFAK